MAIKLRTKPLKDGRKSFYLDIYLNGVRSYEFLSIYISPKDTKLDKKEKKTLAESIRAKRELEANNDDYGFVSSSKKKADFIQYFLKFINTYQGSGLRKFKASLRKFDNYLKFSKGKPIPSKSDERKWETLTIRRLDKKICQGYCDYLKNESGLSGETPFDYFKRFQRVINKAIEEELILRNPAKGIKISKENNQLKKEVLSIEELQALASSYCGNEQVKRVFLFACFTGLGMAEIRKLTWERIQNDKIKLYREKNGRQIINTLHPVALKMLGERGKTNESIFILPSDVAIAKNIRNWTKQAGLDKKITFYCARHTFATQLLINGANLKTVADCMGHSSTQHTVKYLNYVNELKDEAINNLPSITL